MPELWISGSFAELASNARSVTCLWVNLPATIGICVLFVRRKFAHSQLHTCNTHTRARFLRYHVIQYRMNDFVYIYNAMLYLHLQLLNSSIHSQHSLTYAYECNACISLESHGLGEWVNLAGMSSSTHYRLDCCSRHDVNEAHNVWIGENENGQRVWPNGGTANGSYI